jgi:hypothetical protein
LRGWAAKYRNVRLSPDEKSIAFDQTEEANTDVWALDLVRGVPSRITLDPAQDNLPIWSADGRRILWPSRRSGALDLFIKAASGTGQTKNSSLWALLMAGGLIGDATASSSYISGPEIRPARTSGSPRKALALRVNY